MIAERAKETLAMMMIGDCTLGLLQPQRHLALWDGGPAPWRDMIAWCERHPGTTRLLSATGLALGLWLASRQRPSSAQGRIGK